MWNFREPSLQALLSTDQTRARAEQFDGAVLASNKLAASQSIQVERSVNLSN